MATMSTAVPVPRRSRYARSGQAGGQQNEQRVEERYGRMYAPCFPGALRHDPREPEDE